MKRFLAIISSVLVVLLAGTPVLGGLSKDVNFSQSDLTFSKEGEYDIVELKGCIGTIQEIGTPQLPAKEYTFVIPQDRKVKEVLILESNFENIQGEYYIYPVQYPIPVNGEDPPWIDPDPVIYSSSTPYPGKIAKIIDEGYKSGFHLVTIKIYPVQYIPKKKILRLYTNISFQLELTPVSNNAVPVYRRSELSQIAIENMIKCIVENPEDVVSKKGGVDKVVKGPPENGKLIIKDLPSLEGTPVDYVIITSDDLFDEFQQLADWRTKTGIVTIVKSTSWIDENYPGCDLQEKVRNFIKDAYSYWGSIWFLLGGDINIISSRIGASVLTDLYFAGLEGNWNANGNSKFGEYSNITLLSVFFIDEDNGWAVGNRKTIINTTDGGENWTQQEIELSSFTRLNSIDFVDINRGWTVGDRGIIFNTVNGGVVWEEQTSNNGHTLYGVNFVNAQKGWAVGCNGTIIHTTDGGENWENQTSPVNEHLRDVSFVDEEMGWAVGTNGSVIYTINGTVWNTQNSPTLETLTSVCFVDQNNGWAVGNNSTIIHTTDGGENWEIQPTGIEDGLYFHGVSFIDAYTGWIVGSDGVILNTIDGGDNWMEQESGLPGASFKSIFSLDANKSWVVGSGGIILLTKNGGLNWNKNCMVPPDYADFYPDIFLGRAPVENIEECGIFFSKMLKYETNPETNYLEKMLFMGGSGNIAEDGVGQIPMEDLQEQTWYQESNLADFTLCELYGPEDDPLWGEPGHEIPWWDGDAELTHNNAITAINDGYHIIIHVDHSNPYAMGTGVITNGGNIWRNDMDNLENGEKYPILWTGGCSPNAFDYDCVTEHFMNKENGGGVAIIGNTHGGQYSQYTQYWRFLESLFSDGLYKIGQAFATTQNIGLSGIGYYDVSNTNLLGDPYMPIWTYVAKNLLVSHPEIVFIGPQEFTVHVTDYENVPVDSALVCLRKGIEAYTFGFTDASGEITFNYTPETCEGEIEVTVTAQNFVPYEGICTIYPIPDPYICYSSHIIDDDNLKESNGNNDGIINPGETVEVEVSLKNTGGDDATSVTAILETDDNYIEIIDNTADFGDIPIGQERSGLYIFKVLPARPSSLSDINFNLNISNGIWEDSLKLPILSDSLEHTGHSPLAKKWEIFYLSSLELTNYGFGAGDSVIAILRTPSPGITIIDSVSKFGQIQGKSVVITTDRLSFSTLMTDSWPFYLVIRDRFDREWEQDIKLYYPQIPINPPDSVWSSLFGQDFIDVKWKNCNNAMGYNIFRSSTENGIYERLNTIIIKGTSYFHDENLFPYTDYYFKIETVDSSGNRSQLSEPICIKTNPPYQVGWPQNIEPVEINTSCPVTGDINGDGNEEVVICSQDKVYVWDCYGNTLNSNWPIELPGATGSSPALADMDGDGKPDVLISQGSKVYAWKDDGTLLFTLTAGVSSLVSPAIADINGDGSLDILSAGQDSAYAWNSNSHLSLIGWPVHLQSDKIIPSPAVGDIDNNGDLEVVIVTYNTSNEIGLVYAINHDGSMLWEEPYTLTSSSDWIIFSSPTLADLNNNGCLEIIFGSIGGKLYVLTSEGEDFIGWPQTVSNGVFHTPALGDIDADGYTDIVISANAEWHSGKFLAFNHLGECLLRIRLDGCSGPIIGDVNENSDVEIIIPSTYQGEIYAFKEDSSLIPGFPLNLEIHGYNHSTPAISDLDRDGDIEIISSATDGKMYVWDLPHRYNSEYIEWRMKSHDRWRTGNYEMEIPERLLSTTNEATAYSNQRKLVLDSHENLHLVYQADAGCYYTSSNDDGKTWNSRIRLCEGKYPALAIDNSDGVNCCWIKEVGDYGYGLYYTDNFGTTIDTLLEEVGSTQTNKYVFAPPAMVIDENDQVHVVVEVIRPILTEAQIKYRNFPVGNPDGGIQWETVYSYSGAETGDIASPSIDVDETFIPHIVFERRWGYPENHLYYATRSNTEWDTIRVADGRHPFIDCIDGEVHIVYEYENNIWHHIIGGETENMSNTSDWSSESPQILDGIVCAWSEYVYDGNSQDDYEILCRFWNGTEWGELYNLSNTTQDSKHPQITLKNTEVTLSLAWTEGDSLSYEVKTITTDTAPPSPPQGLSGVWEYIGKDWADITLNWNPNPEPDIMGYYIYRSESSSGPFDNVGTAEPLETPVFVDRVYAWEPYWYYVTAFDILNKESDTSDTIKVEPEYYPVPCPFLFTWNGSDFIEDNNILAGIYPGVTITDLYKLTQSLIETNPPRRYKLEIREEETEHSFFDMVSLKLVDHPQDVEIGINVNDEITSVSTAHTPLSAISGGEDYVDVLVSDTTWFEGCDGDTMAVEFGIIDEVDDKELWLESDRSGYPISIEIERDGWEYVTSVFPRDNFSNIPITSLSELIDDEEALNLRLIWFADHNLKTIRIVQLEDELIEERTSPFVLAIHSRLGNVIQKLLNEDENYADVLAGDTMRLEFAFLPEIPGWTRSFVFISNGYYIVEGGGSQMFKGNVPIVYSLSIYPNPAMNETNIKFSIPIKERVTLKMYDISGRKVKTIVDEIVKKGYHIIQLDNRNLPSGVYFARLVTDSFVTTKKLVLVK